MRFVRAAVALAYGAAFLVTCLGGCLGQASADSHACCAQEQGLKAPSGDCCEVVAGVAAASLTSAPPPAVLPALVSLNAQRFGSPPTPKAPPVTPSPPLVLRI